ncbi:uncharacterized protein LOC127451216 isoform X2 [Myxocyprinus asiaticus]|uniref:uncharacterized protein LOC127451216 isoform X2 n=1 Tax=Myxocyprinus asiaticus TaxID=70543 RepID=UPI002221EBC6|nr:uncharacterized protein LOC127451216 isoform X2 [Myxocyprinus asiaticus]
MDQEVSVEQEHLLSIVSNAQCGRMDEQRCSLCPRTPQVHPYSQDPDEFFQLLVNSQSRRLDDQRVTLTTLPGMKAFTIKDQKEGNTLKANFGQICNMVGRANSFRRGIPPKISLTPGSPGSTRRASFSPASPTQTNSDAFNTLPSKSASFSPISDMDRMQYEGLQVEQDQLLNLVSQVQRGRMDEQRCSINPLSPSPRCIDNNQLDQDAEQFFKLIANTQNRRLDDQRATFNLPGTQTSSHVTGQDSDQLFNMISRLQGSRIDDQCCSAPQIQLGSPAPPRKSHSRPVSLTNPPSESVSPSKSASFTPDSEVKNSADQDQLFSLVHHVQRGRMDDQRCPFEPSKKTYSSPKSPNTRPTVDDPDQFFKLVANSQSRQLDDQRVSLSSLPGFQPSSFGTMGKKNKTSAPQIVLTPASPAVPKKTCSRPASPTLTEPPLRPPPRSASFSPVSDRERLLYDDTPTQITFQISMSFSQQQRIGSDNQPCQFPKVFLTVGQAGEAVVIPLSPEHGRPVSLNVNPPRKHCSRSASPCRSPASQRRSRPSSPNPEDATSQISQYEDYFSLIQKVHTAQLQQSNGRDRETSKEARKGKGKSGGRKEKKDGEKRKK